MFHNCCWNSFEMLLEGKEWGEVCDMFNNLTRCTTCELIIPHNVRNLG
jgi:hypothetical protein